MSTENIHGGLSVITTDHFLWDNNDNNPLSELLNMTLQAFGNVFSKPYDVTGMHSFGIEFSFIDDIGSEDTYYVGVEISNDGVHWYRLPDDAFYPLGPFSIGMGDSIHIDVTTRCHYVRLVVENGVEGQDACTLEATIVAGEA